MAETPSTMLPLGTVMPEFVLPDVTRDRSFSSLEFKEVRGILVVFLCNHCPYVLRVMPQFRKLQDDYVSRGIGIVAINSNDIVTYPQDGPPKMRELVDREGWSFPFLLDETQEVAKAFHAACTPDFFLFDSARRLVYRGQLDDARPGNSAPSDGKDLRAALEALLAGSPVKGEQKPSLGCNIKWKIGNPSARP